MTNETIIDKNSPLHEVNFSYRRILEFMDLARADEREKIATEQPQGVDVWINGLQLEHQIWSGSDNATSDYLGLLDYRLVRKLGVSNSECAKFKIVRVEE